MSIKGISARFEKYIKEERLFDPKDLILLAVSGGMDSMLMARLFHDSGFRFAVAHCNFHMRDDESNLDEAMVRKMASYYGVDFFRRSFEIKTYSQQHGISIQMAARELRYEWFQQLCEKHAFVRIALAQHADDLTETMLQNIIRGTGIGGLHGIRPIHDNKIRPLLFLQKEEIRALVNEMKIEFREDRSNLTPDYTRNKLRLRVIPLLKDINPSLQETFIQNAGRMASVERLYKQRIEQLMTSITNTSQPDHTMLIDVTALKKLGPDAPYVLFEFLRPYSFSETIAGQVIEGLGRQAGKVYHSDTHVLLKDRFHLIIDSKEQKAETTAFEQLFSIDYPTRPALESLSNDTAYFDANLLTLPLNVRYWQEGDFFHPLGMKGKKKLSDFFTDLKIPLSEKKRIPLVISNSHIIWVVGHRINERFKVSSETTRIMRLMYTRG